MKWWQKENSLSNFNSFRHLEKYSMIIHVIYWLTAISLQQAISKELRLMISTCVIHFQYSNSVYIIEWQQADCRLFLFRWKTWGSLDQKVDWQWQNIQQLARTYVWAVKSFCRWRDDVFYHSYQTMVRFHGDLHPNLEQIEKNLFKCYITDL